MIPNHYRALELPNFADADEVKRAYRQLARRYHPDVTQLDAKLAEAKMKEINAAYDVLGDPDKKSSYDFNLRYQLNPPPRPSQGYGYPPPGYGPPPPRPQGYPPPTPQGRQWRFNISPFALIFILVIMYNGCKRCNNEVERPDRIEISSGDQIYYTGKELDQQRLKEIIDSVRNQIEPANDTVNR